MSAPAPTQARPPAALRARGDLPRVVAGRPGITPIHEPAGDARDVRRLPSGHPPPPAIRPSPAGITPNKEEPK